MKEWAVLFALPNISTHSSIECGPMALVGATDTRIETLRKKHSAIDQFINRFHTEFGEQLSPGLIITDLAASDVTRSWDAVAGFRDSLALSRIPSAWARSLSHRQSFGGAFFSDSFSIYPWTVGKDHQRLYANTLAMLGIHKVTSLCAQSTPALSLIDLGVCPTDDRLQSALLARWQRTFSSAAPSPEDVALFRSLNMASAASQLPSTSHATMYDIGRSVALWVSAFEILAPARSRAYLNVYNLLNNQEWLTPEMKDQAHQAYGVKDQKQTLPAYLYGEIYHARNDFLHGNSLTSDRLAIKASGRSVWQYSAPLYRMALSGHLNLQLNGKMPSMKDDPKALGAFIAEQMTATRPQRSIEGALATALIPKADDEFD